jgi:hypothetical protein
MDRVNWDPTNEQLESDMDDLKEIFGEALEKFKERNETYKDGWRTSGAHSHLEQMKHKVKRLLNTYDGEGGEDLDDAIDLLNYTAFFIIQHRQGIHHDRTDW